MPRSAKERGLVERFAAAYADDDVDGVVALLTDDAWFTRFIDSGLLPYFGLPRTLPAHALFT